MYKIIDGVAYKVEAVSTEDIKIEVDQAVAVITEQLNKIDTLNAECSATVSEYDSQIANYKQQVESISEVIRNLEAQKEQFQCPYVQSIAECQNKITLAKDSLSEKKDIIALVAPEELGKLGF